MNVVSIIYAKGYLKAYADKSIDAHLIFFQLLVASMLAVVSCQNAIMFLICWEIMSLSSFFLVIFENEKKEVLKAGLSYLVFMHISVIFIMLAFAILSVKSNSFDFSTFANILNGHRSLANIVFILFFIGFGTKAGFVPFHNWLPEAHPAAPSHVSAIMSGVMIKTGIYGILRTLTFVGTPSKTISFIVFIVAIVTALYGILYAITQNDIKRLLAYSSIENIGIIGTGIGLGMLGTAYNQPIVAILGYAGGILHILNHSIFKELLFLSAGSVYTKTHTRDIEKLGGLIKSMPQTGILFLIASISICALPPFNGFVSEFLIYMGMFKGLAINNFFALIIMLFGISCLALVGTMAILCFTKAFSVIFLGMPRSESALNVSQDNSKSMILPMCFLALLTILIGVFSVIAFAIALRPVNLLINISQYSIIPEVSLIFFITMYALLFLVILTAIILMKLKSTKGKISMQETWGCGYNKANNHMQYTASSYASPLLSMLTPLFKKVFDIEKPRKLFPESSHFNLQIEDIEEAYIINPLIKYDEWFLSKFESLQSGNIQSYIKYGLIFLIIIIVGSLFIK
ncbi:hydrogenase [bacterium]|nr:hydrogenase [bacterium]